MTQQKPRLRIAPSPTGMMHVGNARAALFNWLFARHNGGDFVVRIEDTDEERNREEWVEGILNTLQWLGLNWDEGPYRQSENKAKHERVCELLLQSGAVYFCDCERDAIDARNEATGGPPRYDGSCRDRGLDKGVLRFRVPPGRTIVRDLVRGDVEFDHDNIEDFVVMRSNGTPMFIVANVVDDIDQRITHVVRGEEHLPNTPKQILLWEKIASDVETPIYAHLPVLVNEKRQKLSKRRDKVSVEMFRDEGYLPAAMVNYLALLGWSPPDGNEFADITSLTKQFRFEDVQKSPAFFDVKKLKHFNGEYIRALSLDEFISVSTPFVEKAGLKDQPFKQLAQLVQSRIETLSDVADLIRFAYVDEVEFDENAVSVFSKAEMPNVLKEFATKAKNVAWESDRLHECALEVAEAAGLKLGKAQAPIRVAITGSKVGLPLFESMVVLGRETTLARINKALSEKCAGF